MSANIDILENEIKKISYLIENPFKFTTCKVCNCSVSNNIKCKGNHLKYPTHVNNIEQLINTLREKRELLEQLKANNKPKSKTKKPQPQPEEYIQEVDEKELKKVYFRLCRMFHPDKNPDVDIEMIQKINVLYEQKDINTLSHILTAY